MDISLIYGMNGAYGGFEYPRSGEMVETPKVKYDYLHDIYVEYEERLKEIAKRFAKHLAS